MRESTPRVMRLWSPGIVLVGVIALGATAPSPAAAQGLFDFLFDGPAGYERSPVASAPDQGLGFQHRVDRSRHKRGRLSPAAGEKPVKTAPPAVGAGPLGIFVHDATLRAGDVVVTPLGLMVYRGGGGSHHTAKEFVSLAKAGGVAAGNRATLTSIDKANRLGATRADPEQVAEANF